LRKMPADGRSEHDEDGRNDHEVVSEDDGVAPHHTHDVDSERQLYVPDVALGRNEGETGLRRERREELPDDQTDGEVWKVLSDVLIEEATVERPHGGDHRAGADGEPE